jgi:hypothetical protein
MLTSKWRRSTLSFIRCKLTEVSLIFFVYIVWNHLSHLSLPQLLLFAKILSIDGNFYILLAISEAKFHSLHRGCLFDGRRDRLQSVMV